MPSTYAAEALTLEHASSPRYHDTYTYTQDDWRRYLYAYYRLVERADREVARIVGVLKAHGLYDDAAIVFLSDHGDGAAAHGWNQKWNLQEEVINVPLIVKPPKGAGLRGVRNDEALSNVGLDLYATVCDYAGVTPDPGRYRGRSLRPVAEGRQATLHDEVFVETLLPGPGMRGWSVVGPRYKYVLYQWGRNREALYDLQDDPGDAILSAGALVIPPFAGITTLVSDGMGNTNISRGAVTYAKKTDTSSVATGEKILVDDNSGKYIYTIQSLDTAAGTASVKNVISGDTTEITVRATVSKVIVTIPVIGFLSMAAQRG